METPGEEPRAEAGPGSARRNAASARGCKSLCAPAGRDRRGQTREARAGYQFTGSCAANQPRLCAATVKPRGADGPGFVSAEAKLFPTPELPRHLPSLRSRSAPGSRAGTVTADAHGLPQRGGGGVPTSEGSPRVPAHTSRRSSSPLRKTRPLPSNPHLSAAPRGRHAPGNLPNVAPRAGPPRSPQAGPSRPPAPSEPLGTAACGESVSVCASPSRS